jgi:hypothetical protein
LFAGRPENNMILQHSYTFGILTGISNKNAITSIGKRLLADTASYIVSTYFKYYLHKLWLKKCAANKNNLFLLKTKNAPVAMGKEFFWGCGKKLSQIMY